MSKKVNDPLNKYEFLTSEGSGELIFKNNEFIGSCNFDLSFIDYETHWMGDICSDIRSKVIENKFNYPTIELKFDENYSEEPEEIDYDGHWDYTNDREKYSIDEQLEIERRHSSEKYKQYIEGTGLLFLINDNLMIGVSDISLGNTVVGNIMISNIYCIVGKIEKNILTNIKEIHFDLIDDKEYLIHVLDFLNEDKKINEQFGYGKDLRLNWKVNKDEIHEHYSKDFLNDLKDKYKFEVDESSRENDDEDLPF